MTSSGPYQPLNDDQQDQKYPAAAPPSGQQQHHQGAPSASPFGPYGGYNPNFQPYSAGASGVTNPGAPHPPHHHHQHQQQQPGGQYNPSASPTYFNNNPAANNLIHQPRYYSTTHGASNNNSNIKSPFIFIEDDPQSPRVTLMEKFLPFLSGFPLVTPKSIFPRNWNIVNYSLSAFFFLFILGMFLMNVILFIRFGIIEVFFTGEEFSFLSVGQHARGFIAIGQFAYGFIAIGQISCGVITIGMVGVGVFTFSMVGVGVLAIVGLAVSSCGYAAGLLVSGFYAHFGLLGIALWNTNSVLTGARVLKPYTQWVSFFPEERERLKRRREKYSGKAGSSNLEGAGNFDNTASSIDYSKKKLPEHMIIYTASVAPAGATDGKVKFARRYVGF